MARIKLTNMLGVAHRIPEDPDEFHAWARSWGFEVYPSDDYARAVNADGTLTIYKKDKYLVNLELLCFGSTFTLTEKEAAEAGLEIIHDTE